ISFSSQSNIFNNDAFLNELHRIIEDQQLEINPKKTRLQKSGFKQEVTGLIVNEKVNVNSRYIKQLRMWLYYWEKYGYVKAEQVFRKDYAIDKANVKRKHPHFRNVLMGKLEYLKMVKGCNDSTYLKLLNRFENLASKGSDLDQFLNIWEEYSFLMALDL